MSEHWIDPLPEDLGWGRGWAVYEAECLYCGHSWMAVVAVGTQGMECPACHTYDPEYLWPQAPDDVASDGVWHG